MITPVTLIKGDRVDQKTDYRDALPVNMYAVNRNILQASGYMLCYPGLSDYATGVGVDRGGNYNERFSEQYRVSGGQLIKISSSKTVTQLGTIAGDKQASMPYSFNTQAVIAGGRMYLYDAAAGFRSVADADLGSPIDGVWVDGYYFLTDGDFIYHTDITDESAIDPLKFATAEFMPDPSLGLGKTQDNKVIVFGRYTIEFFVNTATENFAFTRVAARAMKVGIVATHAKCEASGVWFITGGRKGDSVGVHTVGIGSTDKISTREIDKILSKYTEPELVDMRMESRTEDGTVFIIIHLPNETLCFNLTASKTVGLENSWTSLKSDVRGDIVYRGINGVFDANTGQWVYGDKQGPRIGFLDNSVCTQYENIVEWILYTPFMHMDKQSIDELELETIPGFNTTDDATVAISLTYDGISYSREWWTLYGEPGKHGQRFFIRRLGFIRDWFGIKLRGASRSRMAFGLLKLTHG